MYGFIGANSKNVLNPYILLRYVWGNAWIQLCALKHVREFSC